MLWKSLILLVSTAAAVWADDAPVSWVDCATDEACVVSATGCGTPWAINRDFLAQNEINNAATKGLIECSPELPPQEYRAVCHESRCTLVKPERLDIRL